MIYRLYKAATIAGLPLINGPLAKRLRSGKEDHPCQARRQTGLGTCRQCRRVPVTVAADRPDDRTLAGYQVSGDYGHCYLSRPDD